MDKECCACFRNSNIVNSFLGHPFFNRLVFLSPLDNKIGRNHCCIAFRRTALRHWRHREDQNETGTKKKEVTLRGECFHCAQAPNKWQNEEKKNQLYFLPGWTKKKEEKRNDGFLNLRTMKSKAVCNFEFIISHCETGLCLQRKKRRQTEI